MVNILFLTIVLFLFQVDKNYSSYIAESAIFDLWFTNKEASMDSQNILATGICSGTQDIMFQNVHKTKFKIFATVRLKQFYCVISFISDFCSSENLSVQKKVS